MYYDSRARRLRRKGRINGNRGTIARRDSRGTGHGALAEEEQFGTIGFPCTTGRCGDTGREHGPLLASGIKTGLPAGGNLQSSRIHLEPRPDGRSVENQRASHGHRHTTEQRRQS